MNRYAAVRGLLLASASAAVLGAWNAGNLPPPQRLRPEILTDPVQIADELPPQRISVAGVDYGIERRFSYDIAGVVVSLHDSATWWDTAHAEWGDHINLMDVCLAWGDNAAKDTYRDVHFSNTQWECHFETRSSATWQAFRLDQVSNNHLVTDNAQIARRLAGIHVGDQIHLRGFLVNYTIYRDGVAQGTRVSSQSRTDTGPGACEVIYVESAEVLESPGRNWRWLRTIGLAGLAVGAIAWIRLPVRFDADGN